ncbi:MAG: imidazolonepropionase [Candidatus Marinimicrobia bacterium]|nr:imidazolonepropionase [Candidatus Neomarinimicrobiota bacterium]|tara:strand:+ start:888 stop:2087 length:1200 start_codon:yes stop_codon:yes gene_type:complete
MIKISNIKSILTWDIDSNKLTHLNNQSIYLKKEKIFKITSEDLPFDHEINAKNTIITPGFIDCHTHPIFSSNRAKEFNLRVSGASYTEISSKGGGINSSVSSLRQEDENSLYESCLNRIDQFLFNGTTTLEAKSGYGLSIDDEIKSLNVIKRINQNHILNLIPTFLGAHAIPNEYKNNKSAYIDLICNEMIPKISELKLAEFCDVFCENGYFDFGESSRILKTAKKYSLIPRLHADEFEDSRGLELAIKLNAVSADHLMAANPKMFEKMANSNVIGVILPGTTFFLGQKNYVDAKKMIDAGCEIALASDFNPGSCTINSLPQIMFLAMSYCNMTFEQTFKAVTYNAAKAVNRSLEIGLIKENYNADLLFWDIDNIYEIPYWFNSEKILKIIKNGKLISF